MKLRHIYRTLFLALSISAVSVACDNDDDIYDGPGTPVDPECIDAFFSDDNKQELSLTVDDELAVELTINRNNSDKAADIKLNVETDTACFNVPDVHFDAGQESAKIKVTFPELPTKRAHTLTLTIPEEYTNIYSKGRKSLTTEILVTDWIKIVKDVEFIGYDDDDVYKLWCYSDLYWLEGQSKYKFTNFLESGIDLTFTTSTTKFDADDITTWEGWVTPLDHYAYYKDNTSRWTIADDEGNTLTWTFSYSGYQMKDNNWIPIKNNSYGWYLSFTSYYEDDEDYYNYHGYFRIANTNQTYVEVYWDPADINLEGYTD